MWNEACYGGADEYSYDVRRDWISWGKYNEQTGYFELNGITDITYEEAVKIMDWGHLDVTIWSHFQVAGIRTNLPMRNGGSTTGGSFRDLSDSRNLFDLSSVEVMNVCPTARTFVPYNTKGCSIFGRTLKLKKVIGRIDITTDFCNTLGRRFTSLFPDAPNIEQVDIRFAIGGEFDMSTAKNLNYLSWKKIVDIYGNGTLTIKVHADVFAKLTGDLDNAAVAAMTVDEIKEWMALVPLAAEKDITFVSA